MLAVPQFRHSHLWQFTECDIVKIISEVNLQITWDPSTLLWIFLALLGSAILIALLLLVWIVVRIRRINLPPNADFLVALRATPLIVVIVLDLLDLSMDIFSAPISWVLLSYLGLGPLRGVAVVKDLIPFTNFVPAMTLAWLFARWSNQEGIIPEKTLPRHPTGRGA